MKKSILSAIAIVLVIVGAPLSSNGQNKSYYPDSEGWNRKALQGDDFESFFPLTLKDNLYLVSPNEEGVCEAKRPSTPNAAFIEYRNNAGIKLGAAGKERAFKILTARRSFYAHKTLEEMPVFKIWAEQVSSEEFPKYKEAVADQLSSFPSSNTEKADYKNHEYYIDLTKDLTPEGLKGKNSIGGAYIFFPEKNVALCMWFFNTRYNTPNAYLISKSEISNIVHEIIDSAAR